MVKVNIKLKMERTCLIGNARTFFNWYGTNPSVNREQAVTIIKQIIDNCHAIEGKSIMLMPPKGNDALSHTYQIHIRTCSSGEVIEPCVRTIAKEHNLAVKVQNDLLIIYKPYPNMS